MDIRNEMRRQFLWGAGATALGVVVLGSLWRSTAAFASDATPAKPADAKGAALPPAAKPGEAKGSAAAETDLMGPQALPDIVEGSPTAPITIIEYASMTCPHCARFHATVFPTLKSKYIEKGKVRFMLREFPLDPLATAAFMLARSAGDDQKRDALIDLMFDKQQSWAAADKPIEALFELVKQAGFTEQKFNTTLDNKKLYDDIGQVRDRAGNKYGVDATPTFFINGKKVPGEMTVEQLDKILQPLLKS